MPDTSNELEKIESCQLGNTEAFSYLVEKYKNMVYQLALRMSGNYHDSEDIAQETFLRAYRCLHRYNPSYSFSSWLHKITLNIIRDRLRKKELTTQSPSYGHNDDNQSDYILSNLNDESAVNPENWQIQQESTQALLTAIRRLTFQHREVIVLRHIQNLSYHEMAGILHISLNSVKVRLHRARIQLRELLQRK